jgi:DNA-binding NarL/FixJ family response regulator
MTRAVSSYDTVPTSAIGIADPAARLAALHALTEVGISVRIEAENAASLLAAAIAEPPTVVLVGAQLPGGGVQLVQQLSRSLPDCLIVLLAVEPSETEMFECLRAGAVGYLPRDLPVSSIATALLAVLDGEVALTRAMMARVVEELQGRPGRRVRSLSTPVTKLTSREWDVASLMRSGASTQQIASRLYMSSSTVRVHVSSILHKLHVSDRDAAIRVLAGI